MMNLGLAVAIFAVAALSAGAQQSTSDAGAPGEAQGAPLPAVRAAGQPAGNPGMGAAEHGKLLPVRCELERELDTKSARRGDPVVMKTTEKATLGDGVVIPKGTRIVGRVTDVQAHGKEVENARLMFELDEAELKGGEKLPVVTELQSMSPAQAPDMRPDNMAAPGAPLGESAGPMGQSTMTAGAGPGTTRSVAQLPDAGSPAAAGMATGMASGQSSGQSSGLGSGPAGETGKVVATQGNLVIRTTAIPGVLMAANANGQPLANASGALIGVRNNVHLDGGTKVLLEIAVANGRASQ